jgi:hypothetical protein
MCIKVQKLEEAIDSVFFGLCSFYQMNKKQAECFEGMQRQYLVCFCLRLEQMNKMAACDRNYEL